MNNRILSVAVAASLSVSIAARADEVVTAGTVARPPFALVSGETNAPGVGFVYGKLGWPSIDVGYQYGVNEKFDAGVALSLLYGFEGTSSTQFGIGLNAPLRTTVLRREKISVQVIATPGLQFYTSSPAIFGLNFPVGAILGVQVTPELRVAVGADLNLKILFAGDGFGTHLLIGPAFGPAVEYYVDKNLSISLDTRFGPVIFTGNYAGSSFGFRTQVGVAYRM